MDFGGVVLNFAECSFVSCPYNRGFLYAENTPLDVFLIIEVF